MVGWAGTSWAYHPVQLAVAVVWIQTGLGLWLLFAKHGWWSRLGALASVGWGLGVWAFGEAFGRIFVPGLSWLTGAPGAVLFYCVAGALLALPEAEWRGRRLGRLMLAVIGVFFIVMAVLQAWPGRGFWQGRWHGQDGPLTAMVRSMAQTPQPHVVSEWVAAFAGFVAAHGFAVNLFVVAVLAVLGTGFLTGRREIIRATVAAGSVFCLAVWVLVQDCGVFGGLGTDPNSMIPVTLLFVSGYLAMAGVPGVQLARFGRRHAGEPRPGESMTAQPETAPARPAGRPGLPAVPACWDRPSG